MFCGRGYILAIKYGFCYEDKYKSFSIKKPLLCYFLLLTDSPSIFINISSTRILSDSFQARNPLMKISDTISQVCLQNISKILLCIDFPLTRGVYNPSKILLSQIQPGMSTLLLLDPTLCPSSWKNTNRNANTRNYIHIYFTDLIKS